MARITAAALLVAILSISTQAQSVYSAYWRMAPASPGSGNGVQIGGGADILYDSGSLLLDVDASYVREAKLYVGDGSTFRSQGEALLRIGKGIYAGGGMAAGVHRNSQYTKAQYQPMASVHYRPSMSVDLYGTVLFRAFGNPDNVVGYRGGYRATIPASQDKRWGIFTQIEYTHFAFTSGNRRYQAGSAMIALGLSRIGK
jgi:hypothetical protein